MNYSLNDDFGTARIAAVIVVLAMVFLWAIARGFRPPVIG